MSSRRRFLNPSAPGRQSRADALVQKSFQVTDRHRGRCAVQASLDFVALLLEPAADRDGCLELRLGAPTAKAVAVMEGRLGVAAQLVRPGIEPSLAELSVTFSQ